MSALPTKVAPKNCQKGIMNVPQQMPQRSNAAFGHALIATSPQNPCVFEIDHPHLPVVDLTLNRRHGLRLFLLELEELFVFLSRASGEEGM